MSSETKAIRGVGGALLAAMILLHVWTGGRVDKLGEKVGGLGERIAAVEVRLEPTSGTVARMDDAALDELSEKIALRIALILEAR